MSLSLKKVLTLVFVREPGKILLGMKKRGFGCGRWNGFGGKVEKGETILQGAKRWYSVNIVDHTEWKCGLIQQRDFAEGVWELLEECRVSAKCLESVGLINFEFENEPEILEVHVFQTSEYTGEPVETEEMRPQWYKESDIPFHLMWPDDELWFPYLLGGKHFEAFFLFRGMDVILHHWIKEKDVNLN